MSRFTLPGLTLGAIARPLRAEGIDPGNLDDPARRVDGVLLVRGRAAWAYVSADGDNPLARQRFTAAHELGHAVLHHDRIAEDGPARRQDEPHHPPCGRASREAGAVRV